MNISPISLTQQESILTDVRASIVFSEAHFTKLKNKKILFTGGTGFLGTWTLMLLKELNETLDLNLNIFVLTRDQDKFLRKFPFLKGPPFTYTHGDIQDFHFSEPLDYAVHGATEYPGSLEIINRSTQNFLNICKSCNIKKALYISSGAVYGVPPQTTEFMQEELFLSSSQAIEPNLNDYTLGKRTSESQFLIESNTNNYQATIARCFSFLGPLMQLDGPFAAGNFILNCLNGESIVIRGSGLDLRSYMYPSDLSVCLLRLLMDGNHAESYNIGSSTPHSIKEIAYFIAQENYKLTGKNTEIVIKNENTNSLAPKKYLPAVEKYLKQFGKNESIQIQSAIHKTLKFYLDRS